MSRLIVLWRVTESCNLACPFCAYDRSIDQPRHTSAPGDIEPFLTIVANHARAANRPVLVSWLGGEPLLLAPLSDLTDRLRKETGLQFSVTTNGTTLGSPSMRAHLVKCYTELTISVDGLGETHDQLRKWPGGFDALREGITALAADIRKDNAPLKLRANTILMRDTVDQFGTLCHTLADWGVREVTFNQLGGRDRPDFHKDHRLLTAQADALFEQIPALQKALARRGVTLLGNIDYLRRIQASAYDKTLPVEDCRPCEDMLFVDQLGRFAPCHFTVATLGQPVKAIATAAELEAALGKMRKKQQVQEGAPCRDCLSTRVFAKYAHHGT